MVLHGDAEERWFGIQIHAAGCPVAILLGGYVSPVPFEYRLSISRTRLDIPAERDGVDWSYGIGQALDAVRSTTPPARLDTSPSLSFGVPAGSLSTILFDAPIAGPRVASTAGVSLFKS